MPFLLHVPGMPAGQRTSALVEMVDLMPTLLDLSGVAIWDVAQLEGVSRVPLLQLQPLAEEPGGPAHWKNATFTVYPRCCGAHGWSSGCNAARCCVRAG